MPNNRMQATAGGQPRAGLPVGRAPAAPDAERWAAGVATRSR